MWTEAQNKALSTDGRLLVSASAGSGKTTVMMERAARFLERGGDVSRMVVLTFTNAAAAEMKEKLLKILYERIRQGVNRAHLMQTVKKIPLARICTIDSFCINLYRTYFERLGLSPDLTPLETEESEALFRGAARETLTLATDGDEKTLDFLKRYTQGQKLDALTDYMVTLWRFSDVKPDVEEFLQHATEKTDSVLEADLAERRKRAARLVERAEGLLPVLATNWEKGLATLQKIVNNFRLVTESKTYDEYLSTFWKRTPMDMPPGKKDDLQRAWQDEMVAIRESGNALWHKELSALLTATTDPARGKAEFYAREQSAREDARILCALTLDAYRRYQAEKERERVCDFSEMEHVALKLLEDEEILKEVRSGVDCVFVDEYQDTNGLQEAILNRFVGGELFMVGDVKQSIYRFRFAEPRLFLDKRRLYRSGVEGENVDLNHNFRSEPEILNFTNMVMSEVMTPDFGGVDYRKDAMLVAGKESRGTAEIQVFLYEPETHEVQPNGEIYSVKEAFTTEEKDAVEGEYIADTIKRLVGKADIPDGKGLRKVRYSDIAILTRTKKAGDIFEALEKHRIPYVAEGYDGLEGEERRVLWNLAKVLDNALDDVPLASVMLSIWGFTEGELAYLADKRGFAYGALYAPATDALKEKVERFRAQLNRFRMHAEFMGVDEILTEVMRETGYDAVLARRGGSALARANAFLYRIQTNKYRRDLSAFLANFPQDVTLNLAGETDAVRFTTIHKSKGLEFPVVFLAHAHETYNKTKQTRSPMVADADWGVVMRFNDGASQVSTAGYLAFTEKNVRENRAEESRLAYVAFTRAQSKLFISGKASKAIATPADGECSADWLQYVATRNAKLQSYFLNKDFEFDRGAFGKAEEPPAVTCTVALRPAYRYEGGVMLGNKYAVSGLEKTDVDETEKKQIFGFLGSQSAETGTAYHLIMEKLDFADRTEEAILRLKEQYAGVPGMENVEEKLLAEALKNPVFDGVEQYPLMKEAPFMMFCDGKTVLGKETDERTLVQGVVDLAILKPDGAVLVDYKVSGAPEAVLKERYQVQTTTYRRALEESGIAVKEVYLLILNRNLLIKMD